MVAILKQLYLLLWKNLKLKQRNPVLTVFEVISPLILFLLLIVIRHSRDFYRQSPECQFKPIALASKGPLEALRSFCFLGVCRQGDQVFGADSGLLSDAEYKNVSRLLRKTNELLANPTVRKLIGAVATIPSDLSDPAQTKQIKLDSMFREASNSLFDGVSATDEQKKAVLRANVQFPQRWNVQMQWPLQLLLPLLLQSSDAVPNFMCIRPVSSDPDWDAVRALCRQPKFRANLKSNFDLPVTLGQMASTDADAFPIYLEFSDISNINNLLSQVNQLQNDGSLNVFDRLTGLLQLLSGSSTDGRQQPIQWLVKLSNFICGSESNIMTVLSNQPAAQIVDNATLERVTKEDTDRDNRSAVNLTQIVAPEKFCYDRRYPRALLGIAGWLMQQANLDGAVNIMFGVIPFYPDNPATRGFLAKINETLQSMSKASYFAEEFTTFTSHRIAHFIANDSQMQAIRMFLTICDGAFGNSSSGSACKRLLKFLAPVPPAGSNSSTNSSLSNWRDTLLQIDSLMYRLYYATACFRLNKLRGFNSIESLENYTSFLLDEFGRYEKVDKPRFVASLMFDKHTTGFVKYRLRFRQKAVDSTRNFKTIDSKFSEAPRSAFPVDFKYFTSFFLHIQELLEHGIQAVITGVDAPLRSYLTLTPSACFQQDTFASVMETFLPMLMTISWIYNVSLLVNAIVCEKETRIKEMMKIMGLSDSVHWLSWFITTFVLMGTASVFMTIMLRVGHLIVYSNSLLLFFFILSYVVSTICEAFFISIFFSNASAAAAFAGVIYFLGCVPYSAVSLFSGSMSQSHYLLSSLIPQLAFGIGCELIGGWEQRLVGLQSSNFSESPQNSGVFSFNLVILMLWVDSAIFMLLTWYLEKVFPGAYGVPKPWYFPFTRSFWCGNSKKALLVDVEDGNTPPSNGSATAASAASSPVSSNSSLENPGSDWATAGVEMNGHNAEHFEEEPTHLSVGIAIRNLTKIYEPGMCACKKNAKPFTAVDNLSYNFYEGQVTSFLGHNGAGKSTTMSVLTGLYTPTSGTAFIAGHDIRTDMDEIRTQLGLCPQHNVLFDSLTVEDHIYFYGMLKGLSKAEVEPQIDEFIADVGLQNKKYEKSKNLSGGMKRKLSVAMAFVGGSKIIVLDEPTAGVDPHSRRAIWDVLAKFRSGRTIILTTHHMDEADILGDRICIINKGRLVCSGSPMFLKKVFGEGYTLTLVKASLECDTEAVLKVAQSSVPEASLGECTSSEISVKLPYNSVPKLASLFAELDDSLTELKIASYGIEDSSLEEIFLVVTGYDPEISDELYDDPAIVKFRPARRASVLRQKLQKELENANNDSSSETREVAPVRTKRNSQQLWQQAKALWLKRLYVLRRSKFGFFAEFILPALFILLSLALLRIVPIDGESPAMELAPWYMLGAPERARLKDLSLFKSRSLAGYPDNTTLTSMADRLMQHINNTSFLGTRCMRPDLFSNPDFPCKTQRMNSSWSPAPSKLPNDTSWCRCSYKDYPNSAKCVDWPTPARKTLMSADVLDSMQGYNLTSYLLSAGTQSFRRRFGGYTLFVNDTQPVSKDADSANLETQRLLETLATLTQANDTAKLLIRLVTHLENSRQPENLTSLVNQIWFDNRGYVSGPAYLNTLTNAVMRALANRSLGDPEEIGVSGWTHPITARSAYVQNIINSNTSIAAMTVVSIIFALSFIPASFVLFLISERTTNAKHLQFVSGINPILYWTVNHAWNLLNYLVPLTMVILLFVVFKNYEFVGSETIGPFLATMILFGFSSAPLMYPFSWVMSVPSKAFTMLTCINLGIGFTTTMSVTIVRMIGNENSDEILIYTADILKAVFLVLPHFCLGQSLMELNLYYQMSARLTEIAKTTGIDASKFKSAVKLYEVYNSSWDATRRYLLCMVAHSIVYFILVLLLEYNCCCKQGLVSSRFFRLFYRAEYERSLQPPEPAELDDDVRVEATKVEDGDGDSHLLQLRRLVKIFSTSSGPKAAVKGISLGVRSRECFGFLGVNGAGKTTTFKMLTGDLVPTSGDALVGGFSILTEARHVHKQLGYCPQFDALLPLLTGRETLQLYARIRGVEETEIDQLVATIAKRVGIEVHLDKTTQEYSGGNKRKLSCGIAFIGNPPIVFLDEPTAGMDPGARRFLWRCIQRMVAAGSCIILTTHSMEDCQALCHRLTIMVNGMLQCIGSPQHLRNKFGQGFTVFLHVRPSGAVPAAPNTAAATTAPTAATTPSTSATAVAAVGADTQLERAHKAFMHEFPDAALAENHASVLQYQLKQSEQLRAIFVSVQKLKDSGLVLDYSVNQTTLDQVFINFAKNQA